MWKGLFDLLHCDFLKLSCTCIFLNVTNQEPWLFPECLNDNTSDFIIVVTVFGGFKRCFVHCFLENQKP